MTINFFEPGDAPQPPEKVKIEKLEALPYPDGWRLRVKVNVTPFQQRPNLEIALWREEGGESRPIANLSIIETMHPRMEFVMHIRNVSSPDGQYKLTASLYYRQPLEEGATETPPVEEKDFRELALSIPAAE
jgi:hypothetical protein